MDPNNPIQINLPPVNLTAEIQKSILDHALTRDQHADLRVLILDAAAAIGMDGQGREGLLGYLKFAASTYPKQYLAVISKVVPLQVDAKSTINVIEHVNIVSVPPDRYMPAPSIAPHIEHVPSPIPDLDTTTEDAVQTIEDILNNPTPVDINAA